MRTQQKSFIGFSYQQDVDNKTEPEVQSSKEVRECDDQKGKLPNNANHFLSFLALTNIIAMALRTLKGCLAFDNYKSFPSAEKQKLMVGEWKVYWG